MDRSIPVWVAAALALVVLMALPLGWIGWVSVSSESGPTLAHYATVFQDPQLQKALWNTVVMAFWVGLASVALGAPMAWLTARTDLPGQTLIRGLIMASFVTPPMVAPAILSGFILAVLQALALFGSPAILALPAGFHTITTQIWSFFHYPPKVEMAAAFSIPLLLATALLLQVQKRLLGRRGYASIGGKGGRRRAIPLGLWRYPALGGCLALLACAIFLPYGVLAKAALSRAWAQPLTWDNLTLANFTFTFFEYSATQSAVLNTLELGVMTATVCAGLAALLAYVTNRRLIIGHQVLAFLALAPIVIPGVVLAVGLFIAYTRPPLLLYGTLWILFVAYVTKEMPVGYSQADTTFKGVHPELEDAGRILGAGRLRVLGEITAPLARSGIIATWCFIFIGVIRELSASIILFTPATKVISVVIFDLKEEGQFGPIAVLGLFMLAMTFGTVVLMQRVLGRDFMGAKE